MSDYDFGNYPLAFDCWLDFDKWLCRSPMPGIAWLDVHFGADRRQWAGDTLALDRAIWRAAGCCPRCKNSRYLHVRHDVNMLAWVDELEPCEVCDE